MWRHHGHQQPRRRLAEPQGHRLAKSRACELFLDEMPHLVERHDHQSALGFGVGQFARFVADPFEHRDVGDPEQAGDRAKTHISHGVEQCRQRLHRRRLAVRRRHGEIATARPAVVALVASNDPVLLEVTRAAALAANLGHGPALDDSVENQGIQQFLRSGRREKRVISTQVDHGEKPNASAIDG